MSAAMTTDDLRNEFSYITGSANMLRLAAQLFISAQQEIALLINV